MVVRRPPRLVPRTRDHSLRVTTGGRAARSRRMVLGFSTIRITTRASHPMDIGQPSASTQTADAHPEPAIQGEG